MESNIWFSPDETIKKEILEYGNFGPKPTDYAICKVKFLDVKLNDSASEYLENDLAIEKNIVIGAANTPLDRKIDELLLTIKKDELSAANIKLLNCEVTFKILLNNFESKGLIYQWNADDKCKMALQHKKEGIELFQKHRFIDASFRFSKSLKLLLSIPVPVDDSPEKIDGVLLTDLNKYKSNLYNNLASCYAKENKHNEVIELCTKVLQFDEGNVKALCKRGFAYSGNRNFEKAKIDLEFVLDKEKENKAVIDKLHHIYTSISKQESDYNSIVKKMFGK